MIVTVDRSDYQLILAMENAMKIKNVGARLWTVEGIKLIPGTTTEIDDKHAKSIEGIDELQVVKEQKAQEVEFKEVPTTAKELREALTEKGVEFPANASKAELQDLYDKA